jgi:CRP-like cAMP-binding protein
MSILNNIKILSELSQNEIDHFSMFCQEKFVKAWETLFHEWDEANAMYILADWEVEISNLIEGRRIKLWDVKAEEILWEMALFWGWSRRMATAIVTKDATLITVLSFSIKELTQEHPDLLTKIKSIIEERTVNNRIIESEIKG